MKGESMQFEEALSGIGIAGAVIGIVIAVGVLAAFVLSFFGRGKRHGMLALSRQEILMLVERGLGVQYLEIFIGDIDDDQIDVVRQAFRAGDVTIDELRQAAHDGLCRVGQETYRWYEERGGISYANYREHPSEAALDYAIIYGAVPLGKGISHLGSQTFNECQRMSDKFLQHVINQLSC